MKKEAVEGAARNGSVSAAPRVRGLSWHVWGVSTTTRCAAAGESHWMRSENMGKQAEEVTICPTNQERVHRNIIRAYDTNDARIISGFVSIPEQNGVRSRGGKKFLWFILST